MIVAVDSYDLSATVTQHPITPPDRTTRADAPTDSVMTERTTGGGNMVTDRRHVSGRRSRRLRPSTKAVLYTLLSTSPTAMAACISLQGSKACPAFQSSSVSTSNSFLTGIFPFLSFVSNTETFDQRLATYVQTEYVREKYQTLIGCRDFDLTNTTELYARFTTTVMCNTLVQESIQNCNLSPENSRPVCAETCAQFAQAEAYVIADPNLCPSPGSNANTQIRADFVNCASPANSLSTCIQGIANEPDNCGYGSSTVGLCSYCAKGGINSTDTCCYNSKAESRCAGVVLPTITPSISLPTQTPTSTAQPGTDPNDGGSSNSGLSGGAIAGIVIGAIAGAAFAAILVWFCLRCINRRRGSQNGSVFNQPSPARKGPSVHTSPATEPKFDVPPVGRIARMSALEAPEERDSPPHHAARNITTATSGGYSLRRDDHSSSASERYGDSPESDRGLQLGVLRPPPTALKRTGSLSSSSVLNGDDPNSPTSGGMSSPQGMASQQSEQLPFFRDYYSQDDIHPGDRVAVLWAYQPRAADEFTLDRGDMVKVVGIWDDGWATGILVDERVEEWEARRQAQRDSGVSNTSGRVHDESPPASGEIKAFPLVCVCLPDYWRRTIEGDGSTDTASTGVPQTIATGS
ncbi:hypothetical protein QBC35DRAFT_385612 [Podospora australis]|uniref:SH3 domain-containing protein n=1 Tax=Podospora australis TaxID=1536484 RepID=A0AAN6WSX4_9PEZI|nr:hypothetical protein QBC35DRAFT_385612 [Podospora australis]